MSSEEKRKRMCCNRCRHTFDFEEATVEYRYIYGIKIPEKKCPLCGGTFRSLEVPSDLNLYLYVNDDERYYTYQDKREN